MFKEPLASLPALDKGYLDATPDPPLPAFEREAPSYPTFRVVAAASPTVR